MDFFFLPSPRLTSYPPSNTSILSEITPESAMYYSFHTTFSTPPEPGSVPSTVLGPAAALEELLRRGCTLATKPWVDNHWCLVLWKLAGMVALDPAKEAILEQKRWCWEEVIRQLLYRFVTRSTNWPIYQILKLFSRADTKES